MGFNLGQAACDQGRSVHLPSIRLLGFIDFDAAKRVRMAGAALVNQHNVTVLPDVAKGG